MGRRTEATVTPTPPVPGHVVDAGLSCDVTPYELFLLDHRLC